MARVLKEQKHDDGRRGDIVRAAAKLFRDKGYDGASMRAIANAVGMQCGSPFYHFASKQDILVAVVEEGLRQGLEKTRAVVKPNLPADVQFRALVKVHLSIILEDGNVMRVGFAGHNGYGYVSIGRALIDAGELLPSQASWGGIRNWISRNPAKAEALLAHLEELVAASEVADASTSSSTRFCIIQNGK